MNSRELVSLSLIVGIGAVLHTIIPGVFLGIKPDLMLTMMFLGIILFPHLKHTALLGIVTGIISAMTTNFPGGQIPNIIDKVLTAFIFLGLLTAVRKMSKRTAAIAVLTAAGTMISGMIFLGSAFLIAELPGPFLALFALGVLPAALLNTIGITFIHPLVKNILSKTNIQTQTR